MTSMIFCAGLHIIDMSYNYILLTVFVLVDIKKTRYKKPFTHVESHASAVSLLESGE